MTFLKVYVLLCNIIKILKNYKKMPNFYILLYHLSYSNFDHSMKKKFQLFLYFYQPFSWNKKHLLIKFDNVKQASYKISKPREWIFIPNSLDKKHEETELKKSQFIATLVLPVEFSCNFIFFALNNAFDTK